MQAKYCPFRKDLTRGKEPKNQIDAVRNSGKSAWCHLHITGNIFLGKRKKTPATW